MVAVTYIDFIYVVIPFPLFPEENVNSHRHYNGVSDFGEYAGTDTFRNSDYGEGLYTDLHLTEPAVLLVCLKGSKRQVFLYVLYGGYSCALDHYGDECSRVLFWGRAVYTDVSRQTGIVSVCGMDGGLLY